MAGEKPDLRTILVREAARLLGEGTSDISIRSVAKAAGVSPMAPYRHFEDKAALLGAVVEEGFAELRRDLAAADAQAVEQSGQIEALIAQGLAYIAFAERRSSVFRLMFAGEETVCRPVAAGESAYGVLARRVDVIAPGRAEVGALACWSAAHGLATLALDRRIAHDDAQSRAVLTLVAKAVAQS